jgi:hypothetical protein
MDYGRQYYAKAPLNGLHEFLFGYKKGPGHGLQETRKSGRLILGIQQSTFPLPWKAVTDFLLSKIGRFRS